MAGKIPTNESGQPATKKRRGLLADLILNGKPTNNVFGRPRKSAAAGTVSAIGPSQRVQAPRVQPREFLMPSIEKDDNPGSGNDGGNGNSNNGNGNSTSGNGSNGNDNDDDEGLFV